MTRLVGTFAAIGLAAILAVSGTAQNKLAVDAIVSVYDGDTFTANLYSLPAIFGDSLSVRLRGIQTPEIRGTTGCEKEAAIRARDFLARKLKGACRVELSDMGRDKYFRLDCTVYADGHNVNQMMLDSGLAVPYDGTTAKPAWVCR